MKTKSSNKLNLLFTAMALLLIFVASMRYLGGTNSWLIDNEDVKFTVIVASINIDVKQGERKISDGGSIYLNTKTIESDKKYDFEDVAITNNEKGTGYYIRCKLIAKVNGVEHNINNYVTSEFYKSNDGWMYYTLNKDDSTAIQMPQSATKIIMSVMTIPSSIIDAQGKYFAFYLFVEGSPSSAFDI